MINQSARKYAAAACAAVSATFVAVQAQQTPPVQSRSCLETVHQYAVLRDHGPAEKYAALFSENGEFIFGDQITRGRAALAKRVVTSLATERAMHLMTSTSIDETKLEGISYVTVLHGEIESSAINAITYAEYHDLFARIAGDCVIERRELKVIFHQTHDFSVKAYPARQ